jgi:hypothetical protein
MEIFSLTGYFATFCDLAGFLESMVIYLSSLAALIIQNQMPSG